MSVCSGGVGAVLDSKEAPPSLLSRMWFPRETDVVGSGEVDRLAGSDLDSTGDAAWISTVGGDTVLPRTTGEP